MIAQINGIHRAPDILTPRFASRANSQRMKPKQTSRANFAPISMAEVLFADRFQTCGHQQLARMIEKPDEALHEKVMPHEQQHRRDEGVARDRQYGFADAAGAQQMLFILAALQCAPQQVGPPPTLRRHDFINNAFVAPKEPASFLDHSFEKVLVLTAGAELRAEGA